MCDWIETKDKMPPDYVLVIVADRVAYRLRNAWWTLTGEVWPGRQIQWEVTQWMPLPCSRDATGYIEGII